MRHRLEDLTTVSCATHRMWAQDVAVHILCAHRVAQDMTAISCRFGAIILCGAQDVAGCAQDMVCRILCAAQDLGSGSHRIWPPRSCARHRMWAQKKKVNPVSSEKKKDERHVQAFEPGTLRLLRLTGIRTRAIGMHFSNRVSENAPDPLTWL